MTKAERPASDSDVLWTSSSPRFGVVRGVVLTDPYAAQFDDLNGDYREVCLTVFRRDGSTWEELLYVDDAGYPDVGEEPGRGYGNGYAWAVGRGLPGARIRVLLGDERYLVTADAVGWWLFVHPTDQPGISPGSGGFCLRFGTE